MLVPREGISEANPGESQAHAFVSFSVLFRGSPKVIPENLKRMLSYLLQAPPEGITEGYPGEVQMSATMNFAR
ncbi:MAG: hypothetical protein IH592_02475 [Bacteroidales bacterium]|nr:hypothetical protein [Bacteroidales bacterium]